MVGNILKQFDMVREYLGVGEKWCNVALEDSLGTVCKGDCMLESLNLYERKQKGPFEILKGVLCAESQLRKTLQYKYR